MKQQWAIGLGVTWLSLLLAGGCDRSSVELPVEKKTVPKPLPELTPQVRSNIEHFCGDCHAMPFPSTFPKANWPEEVSQGFAFYIDSQRTDLVEPNRADVVRYFQEAAPDNVTVPRADTLPVSPTLVRFQRQEIASNESSFASAHLLWNERDRTMLLTDMHSGTLFEWRPDSPGLRPLAKGKHFCRATKCDWNKDGKDDYLLGEMGTFPVGDHTQGRVSVLLANDGGFEQPVILADQLSRVVEVVPLDYDDDGDHDLVVADFGWRRTGSLRLLRNESTEGTHAVLKPEILENRHGALGVQLADMNGDGRMDFVVSFGQEFETVEVFYNRAGGMWERRTVYQLPDPSYNASSVHIADVDKDGRLDIVHTCGDTMDALIPKPYHGVHWLRNMGGETFKDYDLGLLVGALQATVADFDNDGDLDIAAVGLFPDAYREPGAYDSICWWEQQESLQFVRHSIERDLCDHAACTTADIDQDGRMDLIVGDWMKAESTGFQVFFNRLAK